MKSTLDIIKDWVLSQGEAAAAMQAALCSFKAVGPESGGSGEAEKAEWIASQFKGGSFQAMRADSPDVRVKSGIRPNLILTRKGRREKKLWLFSHMDVVPPGDPDLWESDPWIVRREGDLLYGRGVEDNQQALCSMLLLARCLEELDLETENGLGLVFMSDEENGSAHGLKYVLEKAGPLFKPSDLYVVPDGGSADGSIIEIAEKAQLWLKFTVLGKQCHASSPRQGVNSLIGASRLITALQRLNEIFPQKNPLFKPPVSTFIPTRHEENVGAINILPGKDVFYLDCRLLPGVNKDDVIKACRMLANEAAEGSGLSINIETVQYQPASMLPEGAPVIGALEKAIYDVYGIRARPAGIGGATVAAFLRERGLEAAVWSCLLNTCHQPNERSSITALLRDSAVFAELLYA